LIWISTLAANNGVDCYNVKTHEEDDIMLCEEFGAIIDMVDIIMCAY
jgi:Fe2+ or Zn2+ uptake regulation protein